MNNKIKAVYLPTEDDNPVTVPFLVTPKGAIYKHSAGGEFRRKIKKGCVPQHLYVTVSNDVEPIKEGDWVIETQEGQSPAAVQITNIEYELATDIQRKIIATTDPKLLKEHDDNVPYLKMRSTGIAKIQESFIKEFVTNPDGEWEVEYSWLQSCVDAPSGHIYELKLNQDNTVNITSVKERGITITSVKEKMYSLEQIRLTFQAGARRGYCQRSIMSNIGATCEEPDEEDWIKENL
jgi:hypothetical protein